ncbi:MAG: hypothetical protein JKY01_02480, partial [Pseudomonadales bacterium]|nr:hypothetical protein [Pseudomonadales bacterium]
MLVEFLPLLLAGFGLGFIHALDADHIMAVSMLSNQKSGFKKTVFHSGNWALGHGGILLISGVLFFGLGISIPETLQYAAEIGVGLLLIGLGVLCLIQFRKDKIKL